MITACVLIRGRFSMPARKRYISSNLRALYAVGYNSQDLSMPLSHDLLGYKETTIAGPADLEKHLGQNSEDPHYCMM
jgi:hypothetical protein